MNTHNTTFKAQRLQNTFDKNSADEAPKNIYVLIKLYKLLDEWIMYSQETCSLTTLTKKEILDNLMSVLL